MRLILTVQADDYECTLCLVVNDEHRAAQCLRRFELRELLMCVIVASMVWIFTTASEDTQPGLCSIHASLARLASTFVGLLPLVLDHSPAGHDPQRH